MEILKEFTIPGTSWEKAVETELKKPGAAETLKWYTDEGLVLDAYHNTIGEPARNTALQIKILTDSKPAEEEFYNVVQIPFSDPGTAGKNILVALNGGANGFRIKHTEASHLNILLREVMTEFIYLELHGHDVQEIPGALLAILNKRSADPNLQKGLINFSPLSELMDTGNWHSSQTKDIDRLVSHIANISQLFPALRAIEVNAAITANAGANITQQIAYALSQGAEYLAQLNSKGLNTGNIASRLQFRFGIGQNYLLECVKLNVFRLLWSKVLEGYETGARHTFITTETSTIGTSVCDSYTNILRYTTASMSAIIAGSDAHTALPFDAGYRTPDEFSSRIARNINNILIHESFLDESRRATEGSYFFENLQHQLAVKAWELFCTWEDKGGFLVMATSGELQKEIAGSADKLMDRFSNNEICILGVNRYPNTSEKVNRDPLALSQRSKAHSHGPGNNETCIVEPLKTFRIAERTEQKIFE